ncbi:unnamed protein product [Darwinula stevensoni]|uniref:Heat shock protein 90 n=1 Tax=Darwinula stevensoni TaxID=69355 RepID=A0A7R9FSQ5_9CRUS|nr:unnamed protein product [Darwinula stevensoni]CAG0904275.1 unnamed protein product [Darwinula stevensoni]
MYEFEALDHPEWLANDPELKIRIDFDKEDKTLTIEDNGIGLSKQEAIDHLGTIAKSGTKDFVSKLSGDQKQDSNLIGQFGVGFYSGFMVADKITVESRRAGLPENDGVRWVSGGSGDFEVETIDKPSRGTKVILHLRDDADQYLSFWKIKEIVGKYSDHISLPIEMREEKWVEGPWIDPADESKGREPGKMVVLDTWQMESRTVKAIRDGSTKRVLGVLEDLANRNELPTENAAQGASADEVIDAVTEEDKAMAGKYDQFYQAFGAVLKEGLGEDFANRDRISRLLRFQTTLSQGKMISFSDYKARMPEGQKAMYYITADSLAQAQNSPQLEVFKKKGIEVLLMTDRVDEWALSHLHEFDGVPLKSVAKGAVDLGDLQNEQEKAAEKEAQEAFKSLLDRLKVSLKDKAQDVRITSRLVDSPACLVVSDYGMSTQLTRLLKQAGQPVPDSKPILEINPDHGLVKKLENSAQFDDYAQILFDQALLAEGGVLDDPAAYVRRVNQLLV